MDIKREDVTSDEKDRILLGRIRIERELASNDDFTPDQAAEAMRALVKETYRDSGKTPEEMEKEVESWIFSLLKFYPSKNKSYKDLPKKSGTHVSSKRDSKTRS